MNVRVWREFRYYLRGHFSGYPHLLAYYRGEVVAGTRISVLFKAIDGDMYDNELQIQSVYDWIESVRREHWSSNPKPNVYIDGPWSSKNRLKSPEAREAERQEKNRGIFVDTDYRNRFAGKDAENMESTTNRISKDLKGNDEL